MMLKDRSLSNPIGLPEFLKSNRSYFYGNLELKSIFDVLIYSYESMYTCFFDSGRDASSEKKLEALKKFRKICVVDPSFAAAIKKAQKNEISSSLWNLLVRAIQWKETEIVNSLVNYERELLSLGSSDCSEIQWKLKDFGYKGSKQPDEMLKGIKALLQNLLNGDQTNIERELEAAVL